MSTTGDAGRISSLGGGSQAEGVPLHAVIDAARRLDELSIARLIEHAAELVHKAQTAGQPLGTLSPRAIVVLPDGTVKLEAAPSVAHSAPERLVGQAGDRRSDVFSLGALLWEALAHAPLFEGAHDEARKAAVLGKQVRPPSEQNANVPAALDAICKKALARDPADRYQSAKVMAAEISAVLDDAGYPETNVEIVKFLEAGVAPAPAPAKPPAANKSTTTPPASKILPGTTNLGMPPLKTAGTLPPPLRNKPITNSQPTPAKPLSPTPVSSATPGSAESEEDLAATLKRSKIEPIEAVPAVPRPPTLPPAFAKTQILGSPSAPVKPQDVARTAILGSNMTAPAAVAVPDPARTTPFGSSAMTPPAPAATPATASTEATPALAAPVAPASPMAPTGLGPIPGLAPTSTGELATSSPGARAAIEAPLVDKAAAAATAAAVVALPRAPSASDGGTGPRDVLAGWGWTTGSVEAIDDEGQYEDDAPSSRRRRLIIAIGAGAGALFLLVIIAIAAGGSKKPADTDQVKVTQRADSAAPPAAAEPTQTADNPQPAPTPPEPSPKPPEPAPPGPAPVNTEAVAQPPPGKIERPVTPPRNKALVETQQHVETSRKNVPKKIETPRKTDHKPVKVTNAKPVDPYATPEKKVDPAAAYKTGFQQLARGDTSGALATLRGSLSSSPSYAPTWRGLGMVYEKLGQKAQAKTAFKRYLQLSPAAGDSEQIRDRLERL